MFAGDVLIQTNDLHLDNTGDPKSSKSEIVQTGTHFFSKLCRISSEEHTSMNHLIYIIYTSRKDDTPHIKTMPQTDIPPDTKNSSTNNNVARLAAHKNHP